MPKKYKTTIPTSTDSKPKEKNIKAEIVKAYLNERKAQYRKRSDYSEKLSQLMQLKFQMEEYTLQKQVNKQISFSYFLKAYVDILYRKRKEFAEDINIHPLVLSHIINQRREPQEKFIQRLTIHSERVFEPACKFDHQLWFTIFFKDKMQQVLTQPSWRQEANKEVELIHLQVD